MSTGNVPLVSYYSSVTQVETLSPCIHSTVHVNGEIKRSEDSKDTLDWDTGVWGQEWGWKVMGAGPLSLTDFGWPHLQRSLSREY